ncbi:MAG: type II toxin-antitoxin system VapC family toxin [Candidatus Lokiarchaeota archaeon]|nr:type II toxin-antitoxin system VapC family toxin [Candidatus Lokiarchaeota archaeon]
MARKIKIYLDTSVISAKFDDRNPDRKELTENFFVIIDQYDPYISRITIAEIENTPDEALKSKMQDCVKGFNVLEISEATENLARQYVKGGAIPKKYQEDAYHIAFAVINEVDYLLSWNFKHVVKQKTRAIANMVNTINRYRNIDIITPAELE